MNQKRRIWCLVVALLIFLQKVAVSVEAQTGVELKKEALAIGYIHGQFHQVNRLDAEAAFKTLTRTLGIKHGYDVSVTVEAFDNGKEIATYMKHSRLDLIVYNSLDYLLNIDNTNIEPIFVPEENGKVLRQYVLLSRNPQLNRLEMLRNRSLNVYYGPNNSLAMKWLDVLLHDEVDTSAGAFFGSVDSYTDPLAAILPVFFGKRDVVLVDVDKFEIMTELNPQLKQLKAVVTSEPYLCQIICFNRTGWTSEEFRQEMLSAMATLHETPAGRQILMLFKAEKVVPYEPRYLESTFRLERQELVLGPRMDDSGAPAPALSE